PNAQLFYNEYGIEVPGPKTDAVYALVAQLKAQGVPIDGIGLQFHVTAYDFASFEMREPAIRTVIERFAGLGLRVRISELDVRVANLPDHAAALSYQGNVYHALTQICQTEPACSELTLWGFTDKYSW